MTATDRARARWASPVKQGRRRDPACVLFDRDPDGTLLVDIGGTIHRAPVPMSVPFVWSTTARRRVVVPDDQVRPGHPGWITVALDMRSLTGPAVDEALGVEEPAVDEWEAGTRRPTVEQLRRLATLTSFPVSWFTKPNPPENLSALFICGRDVHEHRAAPATEEEAP